MKNIFFIIALITFVPISGAQTSDTWDNNSWVDPPPKTRVDNIRGILAYIGRTYDIKYNKLADTLETVGGGWEPVPVGYSIYAAEGHRLDSIVSYWGYIPCPEGRPGCALLHLGWSDYVKSSTYYLDCCAEPIEKKNVIHFAPND